MSIEVPGVGNVPIIWKPSPDFNRGRAGYQPIAIVHHRAVASVMESIDAALISSSRQVSATFAIGHRRDGALVIHQYVDVSDTQWTNGINPTNEGLNNWTRWGYTNTNHNAQTVAIEHEDQGGSSDPAKRGIVREDILKTSIELDRLLLTGDITKIRAAGIHIRDTATAAALKKMPRDGRHLIDHRDIAPVSKPYCWRPWAADKVGFPRARYIRELTGAAPAPAPTPTPTPTPTGGDMPALTSYIPGQIAKIKVTANVRSAPVIASGNIIRVVTGAPESWTVTGWSKGSVDPDGGSDQWLVRWNAGKWEYTAKSNVTGGPAPTPDTSPYTQAQVDAQVKAATDAANARIATMKQKTAAFAVDIADE